MADSANNLKFCGLTADKEVDTLVIDSWESCMLRTAIRRIQRHARDLDRQPGAGPRGGACAARMLACLVLMAAVPPSAAWGQEEEPTVEVTVNIRQDASDTTARISGVSQELASSRSEGTAIAGMVDLGPVDFRVGTSEVRSRNRFTGYKSKRLRIDQQATMRLFAESGIFILQTARHVDDTLEDDTANATNIKSRFEWITDVETGIVLFVGVFRAGAFVGNNRIEWNYSEFGVPIIQENYKVNSFVQEYAIELGDDAGPFLNALYRLAEVQGAGGDVVDFDGIDQEQRRLSSGWVFDDAGGITLSYFDSKRVTSFDGVVRNVALETTTGIELGVGNNIFVGLFGSVETFRDSYFRTPTVRYEKVVKSNSISFRILF